MTVLHCPRTEEVFQWRGEIAPDTQVTSPAGHTFAPFNGNVPEDDGGFICPHCGNHDSIMNSIRNCRPDELLPTHVYAQQAYYGAADPREDDDDENSRELFTETEPGSQSMRLAQTTNLVWKSKGKYFIRFSPQNLHDIQRIEKLWIRHAGELPYPTSKIPKGEKTKTHLLGHHFHHWHQMFCPRQLLALSTLLQAIREEPHEACRELLLLAFSGTLERNNLFCRYFNDRNTIQGSFDRHDYHPKNRPAENCVWGPDEIRGSFQNMFRRVREGIAFRTSVYDRDIDRLSEKDNLIFSGEIIPAGMEQLLCGDSREVIPALPGLVDAIITDPPYAGNVNYSELYDFFYVWLRLALKERYEFFIPEYTPKLSEIVENKTRGLSNDDFRNGLKTVFERGREKLKDDGLLVFTYHHSGNQQWVDLCDAVCLAGFVIEAVYPVHAEKESSLNLQNNEGLSYDLIHVCRKRPSGHKQVRRSWAGLRQLIRQRAQDEIARIEAGRYGSRHLSPADVRLVLIGKCLEIYSQNYGAVLDWESNPFPMRNALMDIGDMVEQMISRESPLPAELENVDAYQPRLAARPLRRERDRSRLNSKANAEHFRIERSDALQAAAGAQMSRQRRPHLRSADATRTSKWIARCAQRLRPQC